MLDSVRGSGRFEPLFDRLQHHVAYVRARDVCIGDRRPGDDLAVEGIDDEDEPDDSPFQQVNSRPSEHQRRFSRVSPRR